MVFLHEGLGSIGLWRSFPAAVRNATGDRCTLVYSRLGYGRSTPVTEPRPVRYMHDEALEVLPAILQQLGARRPVLIGHSDGASIALIHAGAGHAVTSLVLLAPHVFVEDETVAGIEAARATFLSTDLGARMGRHHDDAAATFWGWNRIWLSPEFRSWNIEQYLPPIACPVLLVQGDSDEYGTLAQLDAIEAGVSGPVTRVVLAGARHAPHLDAPEKTLAAVAGFVRRLQGRGTRDARR